MNEIIRDNGFASRKMWFSVFAIVLIFAGAVCAGHWAGIAPLYSTMVGGILGVVGAYLTGNVANKFVGVKALGVTPPDSPTPNPEAKEEPQPKPPAARFSED